MKAIANRGNRAGQSARPVCRWRHAFRPAAAPKGPTVVCMAKRRQEPVQQKDWSLSGSQALNAVAGLLASAALWTATPAIAEIQTVSPQTVTQLARPLPQQTVDKGKVWIVFVGGAAMLFASTILAETNEAWFPAIVRANRAMAEASKRLKEQEEKMAKAQKVLEQDQAEWDATQRQVRAVEEGLAGVRSKVLADKTTGSSNRSSSGGADSSVAPAAAVATSSDGLVADSSVAAAAPPAPKTTREELIAMLKAEDEAAPAAAPAASPAASHSDAADASTAAPPAASSSAHSADDWDATAAPTNNGNAPAAIGVATALHDVASSNGQAAAADAEPDTEADELAARSARLQNFVSSTVSGGKTPLELFKEQQRQQYRQQ